VFGGFLAIVGLNQELTRRSDAARDMNDKIAPKFDDGSVNPLVSGVIKSFVHAIELIGQTRVYHAFSMRACTMVEMYGKDSKLFYMRRATEWSSEEHEAFANWYGMIQETANLAKIQIERNYEDVARNSVVVLADIFENVLESFVHFCLLHYRPYGLSIKEITKFTHKDQDSYRNIRFAIRNWERTLSETSRSTRLETMIVFFFPGFQIDASDGLMLDELMNVRNMFTHELIKFEGREPTKVPSEERVQEYYDAVGRCVSKILDIFISKVEPSAA